MADLGVVEEEVVPEAVVVPVAADVAAAVDSRCTNNLLCEKYRSA